MPELLKWKVIVYGVIGNDKDGYEVNDAHTSSDIAELPPDASKKQIVRAMKDCGQMSKHVQPRHLTIECDDPKCIYIYQKRNHKPIWELRLTEDK